MQPSSKPVANLLGTNEDPSLRRLIARAGQLARVAERFGANLGEPINRHIRLLNVQAGVAHLQADSPAWLARARYIKPQLLRTLADIGLEITDIKISAASPAAIPAAPVRAASDIPESARMLLKACAEQQTDPALRGALLRLSAAKSRKLAN